MNKVTNIATQYEYKAFIVVFIHVLLRTKAQILYPIIRIELRLSGIFFGFSALCH